MKLLFCDTFTHARATDNVDESWSLFVRDGAGGGSARGHFFPDPPCLMESGFCSAPAELTDDIARRDAVVYE
eukprot:5415153-Pyramimonas_sp.AAC.2